jgi:hypothetical protein
MAALRLHCDKFFHPVQNMRSRWPIFAALAARGTWSQKSAKLWFLHGNFSIYALFPTWLCAPLFRMGYALYFKHTFAYEIYCYGIYLYSSILVRRKYKPLTNSLGNTISKKYVNKYFLTSFVYKVSLLVIRSSTYLFLTQKGPFFTKYSVYQWSMVEKIFYSYFTFFLYVYFYFHVILQQYNQYLII